MKIQGKSWLVAALLVSTTLLLWPSASALGAGSCPNEELRTGLSSQLPDCRAYELVTPANSNGRLFGDAISSTSFDVFPFELASPLRDSLIFSTEGSSLQSPPGGGGLPQKDEVYEAERTGSGWLTVRHVTPFPHEAIQPESGGVSADHTYTFTHVGPPTNNIGGEFGSLYKPGGADYLGDPEGHFELTGIGSLEKAGKPVTEQFAQGRYISPDGKHVIFSTGKAASGSRWCNVAISKGFFCPVNQLEPDAPPTGTGAVYDRSADGPTHVVSLLPGEVTPGAGEDAAYQGASRDGTAIAFTIKGTLYVRIHSGEGGAATLKVTEEEASFGGLSADGRYLYYVSSGDVHRFDTETETHVEVNASGDGQMVNVSADGSHVYFISHKQLDGGKGTAGDPNLYAWSGGSPKFIATLLPSDLEGNQALGNWVEKVVSPGEGSGPGNGVSRLTPDGSVLVFQSQAQLTSYDNAGHTEIYRYDEEGESLTCVSCNPEVSAAAADARLQDRLVAEAPIAIHNLSDDGRRVFFETEEALASEDTDGINDVYEWQQPEGEGEADLSLISSGQTVKFPVSSASAFVSPIFATHFNTLLGVTPDGRNVFFLSGDALTPEAGIGGTPAIYDARVEGGFPASPAPVACLEEECKPTATPPPSLNGAASEALQGSGNVIPQKKSKKHKRRCRRHSEKQKRCAKKRAGSAGQVAVSSTAGTGSLSAAADVLSRYEDPFPVWPEKAGAAMLSSEFEGFGIKSFSAERSTPAAGEHPDFTTALTLEGASSSFSARAKDVAVDLPPGFVGDPNLTPRCSTGELLGGACPIDSQIGITRVTLIGPGGSIINASPPVFNLAPPHPKQEIARLGFIVLTLPAFIDVSVDTADDYGVTATLHDSPTQFPLLSAETTIWGNPADPSHDEQRMTAAEGFECNGTACKAPEGKRPSGLEPISFLSNPSACGEAEVGLTITSYQLPGQGFSATAPLEPTPTTECEGLPFEPSFEAHPTSHKAGAPTGLDTVLKLPQSSDPSVRSTSTMREAQVTLPEGMAIAAGAADGLAACSEEQVHFHEEADAQCPDASKLGMAKITSQALPEALEGSIYQRSPEPGHLFRLWLVSDQLGLHIKLPGEIHADPSTGQLTAVFSDLPQVPVEEIELDVWGGPRAPLKNPDACGTYQTTFAFTPHSDDPPVSGQTPMTIDEGCGPAGFAPQLHGGATNPVAGAFSPFVLDLTREDGEQNLAGFDVTLPKGELAKLAGVPLCGEAQAASGACPADSKIGSVITAAGPGSNPIWLPQPGKSPTAVYLAGPYKGAPYSAVSVVPAQAGPFDLGNVVVRSALEVDPTTALATVRTDPLPQFVEGVPVIYRRLHVLIDRPQFTLNPTDCSQLAITADASSTQGTLAHPSARFEVDGCANLAYSPKLKLSLKGQTKRSGDPAVKAVLTQPANQANTAGATVVLPSSEFIDQAHINNPCTRVQFNENACPKGSILGTARAITPLLDQPLEGPVYFRSNGGERELPDIVADLHGPIHITLVGFIDSVHKKGSEISRVRTRFQNVPDAPVTRFTLSLYGGKRGLIENHVNLCKSKHRATVVFKAQNGRTRNLRPVLQTRCGK